MRFSVCMIEPEGYKYSHFLYDSCKYVCYTIEALGYDCCMVKNTLYKDCINIIVGSHNLGDPAMIETIRQGGPYVVFQTEIIKEDGLSGWASNENFSPVYLPILRQALAVWDVSEANAATLHRMGIPVEVVPRFGYLPALREIRHKKNKDIDFLYYGSITPHRQKMIEALKRRGGSVVCLFDEAAIFRNDYIARARVNLAPNQTAENDHLTARILYLLNNQSIVVVERCCNQDWIEHCFPTAPTDAWVDLCMETLSRPDLPQLALQSFERYRQLDMTALFLPLIEKLCDAQNGVITMKKNTRNDNPQNPPDQPESIPSEMPPKTISGLTSVIVLTGDDPDRTKACVESLKRHTPQAHEIILIENREHANAAQRRNSGIRKARGEYILLLDGRTVVAENWLAGMMDCLKYAPEAGVIGPCADGADGVQNAGNESGQSVESLDTAAAEFRQAYRHRQISCQILDGFCLLFKRSLTEQIGFFDESLPDGNFDVEDFCLRAALEGFRHYAAGDVLIHYEGGPKGRDGRSDFNRKWTLSAATDEGRKLAVLKATEAAADLYAKGKVDQAVEALVNIIKVAPDAPVIYYELARLFIESKRFGEAWDVIVTLPESAGRNPKTMQYAGYAKEGLDLDDKAAAYAEGILSIHPDDAAALNLQGVLAYKTGDKNTASNFFQKALEANPGYGEAYTNLGVLSWGLEHQEEALSFLKKGFILSPTVPDVSTLYYSVATSLDRIDEAEDAFREASRLYPNFKNIAFLYIDLLIRRKKYVEALRMIEDALARFGADEGTLAAALPLREALGPRSVDPAKKNTLSLCIIVKNEEKNLAACLRSVRDVVDEMIVVDTGSTDKTKDIARVFGANVYDFAWTGDFSAARNDSLAKAQGDWILALDADEVISPLDEPELRSLLGKGTTPRVAYSIVTRNYTGNVSLLGWTPNSGEYPEEAGPGWMISAKVRLFPRVPEVYFVNPVHELLESSLEAARIPVLNCNVIVHHYGKLDVERESQKGEDYYLMGKLKYESDPQNAKYVQELAKQALILEKYEESVDLWLQLLALIEGKPQTANYQAIMQSSYGDPIPEIYTQLATAYLGLNRFDEALAAGRKSMQTKKKLKEYIHIYALCEILAGDLERAAEALDELLSDMPDYPSALFLKAVVCALTRRKEETKTLFQTLSQRRIRVINLLNKISSQLSDYGRSAEAALLLAAAMENGIGNEETLKLQKGIAGAEIKTVADR